MKRLETGDRFFLVYYTVMTANNRTGPGHVGCRTKNGKMVNYATLEKEVMRRGLLIQPNDPVVLVVVNGINEMTESDYMEFFRADTGMAPDYITFSSN